MCCRQHLKFTTQHQLTLPRFSIFTLLFLCCVVDALVRGLSFTHSDGALQPPVSHSQTISATVTKYVINCWLSSHDLVAFKITSRITFPVDDGYNNYMRLYAATCWIYMYDFWFLPAINSLTLMTSRHNKYWIYV